MRVVAVLALYLAFVAGCAEAPPVSTQPTPLPVRSVVVHYRPFRGELSLLGIVRPAETVPLIVASGGTLDYPVRFARGLRTGERVAAGELVATLDSGSVRLAVAEARLNAASADAELRRAESSLANGLISRAEVERLETLAELAGERLKSASEEAERLRLVAPVGGRLIVERGYPPQTEIPPGTTLAEIAADGPPRVEGWAAASDRERLRAGLSARFAVEGDERPRGSGIVQEVAPVVDAAGTVRVIVGVRDAAALPAPGEGVEVRVELERRTDVLAVPPEALVLWSGGHAVFVLDPRGATYEARRVQVQAGDRNGQEVEIRSGLREGDRVAVAGVSQLTDGAIVHEVAGEDPARADPPQVPSRSE